MNYDEMRVPRPFRWSDYPALVILSHLAAFASGVLCGMIVCAWALARLIP